MKAYYETLFSGDFMGALMIIERLCDADKLRIMLSLGVGGPSNYGFGAQVGRA